MKKYGWRIINRARLQMLPATFPESNCKFTAPSGVDESQIATIPAFKSVTLGGNMDGSEYVVVAWMPSTAEIEQIKNGTAIYLTMLDL
jgi:hypothetical protein